MKLLSKQTNHLLMVILTLTALAELVVIIQLTSRKPEAILPDKEETRENKEIDEITLPDDETSLPIDEMAQICEEKQYWFQDKWLSEKLYHGTWKITDLIPPEKLPSMYWRMLEDGTETGHDSVTKMEGKVFTVSEEGIEYDGIFHPYALKPITFVAPLSQVPCLPYSGLYERSSLNFPGSYLTYVAFYLPENYDISLENYVDDTHPDNPYMHYLHISDCNAFYIIDADSMYLHENGGLMYLVERCEEEQ